MLKNILSITSKKQFGRVKISRLELGLFTALAILLIVLIINIAELMQPVQISIYQQGVNFYNEGHYTYALATLQKAVQNESEDNLSARLYLAETYLALNQPAEADTQLHYVLYYQPKNPAVLYWLGQALWNEQNPDNAKATWQQVIALNQPGLPLNQARLALAQAYFHAGQYSDASDLLYQTLSDGQTLLPPDELVQAYYSYGLVMMHDGRYNDADELFTRVVQLQSQFQLHVTNARMLNTINDLAERASLIIPPLLQARDQTVEAARRAKLGYAYLLADEYVLAEQQFERAVQLVPDFADARAYLGLVYWQTGQNARAVDAFNQALQSQPPSTLAAQLLAEYDIAALESYQATPNPNTQQMDNYDNQAQLLLKQLSQQQPNDALVQIDLAHLATADHDYESAVTYLTQAIKLTGGASVQGINPGVELVKLYSEQAVDPCGRGLTAAQQLLNDSPNDANAWYEAGIAEFMCHQAQPAITDLQHALQLHSNWPEAMYRLALVYKADGQDQLANSLFVQLTDLDSSQAWPH